MKPLLVLSIAWCLFVSLPADTKEAEGLEGEWIVISEESFGNKTPEQETSKMRIAVKDGKIIATLDKESHTATFKIDADKKPAEIDITHQDGPDAGRTERGIYEFTGETLKLCVNENSTDRPKEFSSKNGTLMVLKRVKP
ncbi:MAG TPA: TIGR03067 domain-containing protein [Gemmataceae bacterium]|nr:TIGR03067 domain-containing protein [Gemmataceae bacterium]